MAILKNKNFVLIEIFIVNITFNKFVYHNLILICSNIPTIDK